ncbi:MAG: T9SS type A sorting domain-containing protein [Calditrichaeota bacterium]|nr:T9SS type A sorting domain-containing protein [Calditrichota bacterium]
MSRLFVIYPLTVLLGLFALPIQAVTPDSVVARSDQRWVFSTDYWNTPLATITVSVFDSVGRPVSENTPIAIVRNSYNLIDSLQSPRIFKVHDNGVNKTVYAWTDANGQVIFEYWASQFILPNDSIVIYFSAYAVQFQNPGDPASARTTGSNIFDSRNSRLPVLVGTSSAEITVQGRDGDYFVYETFDLPETDSAKITVRFFDAAGQPLPEGAPVLLTIVAPEFWGYLSGSAIVQKDTVPGDVAFPEEHLYFMLTNARGEVEVTYRPPNTGLVTSGGLDYGELPWHFWFSTNGSSYNTPEDAFAAWEKLRTAKLDLYVSRKNADGSYRKSSYLNDVRGKKPVLVGPSLITFETEGHIFGSEYLFTNKTLVERATISIEVFDDLERPVLPGTPLALLNGIKTQSTPGACGYPITGRLFSLNEFPVKYEPNECGDPNVFAIVRTGTNSKAEFILEPPYASLRAEIPHWDDYDDYYLAPYYLSDGTRRHFLSHSYTSLPPILTSAYDARVQFKPVYLGAFEIFSRARVKVTDTQDRPVPRGATVRVEVDEGSIFGTTEKAREVRVQRSGKFSVPYLSPTRHFNSRLTATLSVYKDVRDPFGQGGPYLGEGNILMEGMAFSPADPSLGKFLLGKSFTDILADLTPLVALGSIREMAQRADSARAARIRLLRLAASTDATETELQQAYGDFRQAFSELAHSVAEFVQDVPGTSVDPSIAVMVGGLMQNSVPRYFRNRALFLMGLQLGGQIVDFLHHNLIQPLFGNSTQSIASQHAGLRPITFPQIEWLSKFHFQEGETGMFKAFGFRFRATGFGGLRADSIFSVGDQYPLPPYLFTEEMVGEVAPGQPLLSPGIIEVETIVDSNTVEFAALGMVIADATILPDAVVQITATDTADTSITALDGNGAIIPATAIDMTPGVVDSAKLFILQMPPPRPVNETDSLVIHLAYALGQLTLPDSSIQPFQFQTPAIFQIDLSTAELDSALLPDMFKPYWYDENSGQWVELPILSGYDSTVVAFEISRTGIYGVGGKSANVPITGLERTDRSVQPDRHVLLQNYPNPFNLSTWIRFYLPEASRVELTVYDLQGRKVKTLILGQRRSGWHTIRWDGRTHRGHPAGSGVYFYQLKAGSFQQVRKMLLIK